MSIAAFVMGTLRAMARYEPARVRVTADGRGFARVPGRATGRAR